MYLTSFIECKSYKQFIAIENICLPAYKSVW